MIIYMHGLRVSYFTNLQSFGISTVVALLNGPRPTVKAAILYW